MSVRSEISRQPLEELMRCFARADRQSQMPEEEKELWLHEIAVQIASAGEKGIDFLLSCIPDAESDRLRAILIGLSCVGQQLSSAKRTSIGAQVHHLLADTRPIIVAEVIDTLGLLGYTSAREDVLKFRHHPSPFVVGSVLRFMAKHFPDEAVPLLEKALESKEPIVRQNAIDELDELNHVPALPRIKQLMNDKNNDVRQAALTAVQHMENVS